VWNIVEAYLDESGPYLCVTAENIPRVQQPDRFLFNKLGRFGPRSENPRVGGSIPPLATIKSMVYSGQIPMSPKAHLKFQQLFIGTAIALCRHAAAATGTN
jgi:hypothetical protein